jgi:hypothetical protein
MLDIDELGIEYDLTRRAIDLGLDFDQSIIGPIATKFKIRKGQVVI